MNLDRANAVYDILTEHAGAAEHNRDSFVYHATEGDRIEFRFQGRLGFGGKFYTGQGRMWVACYPEDRTDERDGIVRATNAALDVLAVPE